LSQREWENGSGYYDPTAYQALKTFYYMPLVYICSPYSGDIETNVEKARGYSRYALEKGTIPIAPHLLFPQFMNDLDQNEREQAMRMNLILLDRCEELWVFGDELSKGMQQEISRAEKRKKMIRWFDHQCKEVSL